MPDRPNLIFVFGDQWRAQAFGYAGDPNARTPRIDAFAAESLHLPNATSGIPVCTPYRACLLTGQYPLTHGLIVNDQPIGDDAVGAGHMLDAAGYDTVYIGKWHIDGHGRSGPVAPQRRLGFRMWLGWECTHDYNESFYWDEAGEQRTWAGYDAAAQTQEACARIRDRDPDRPLALFLSWGPPHAPYETAPEGCRALFDPDAIQLRPNVPDETADAARRDLAGYYAHGAALDACFGGLLDTLDAEGLRDNTIVVFTSDHGDMLGSHGLTKKQHPYAESIDVPFLVRWPAGLGPAGRTDPLPLNAPDILPTLLGLCGAPIPDTVEGVDFSPHLRGERTMDDGGAYLACYRPFHQWTYAMGAKDYRGLRTERYTYARSHDGPYVLFDNEADPYQLRNLAHDPAAADLVRDLDRKLQARLDRLGDTFETGDALMERYRVPMKDGDVAIQW